MLRIVQLSLLAMALVVGLVSAEAKLQIGVLKKVEACSRRSRSGDYVGVHYTGTLEDGSVFDSSIERGSPIEFPLGVGRVIQGWDQGLLNMCVGEKRKLRIPPHLAYGSAGAGSAIPPDATLIFTTELVTINGEGAEEPEAPVEVPDLETDSSDSSDWEDSEKAEEESEGTEVDDDPEEPEPIEIPEIPEAPEVKAKLDL